MISFYTLEDVSKLKDSEQVLQKFKTLEQTVKSLGGDMSTNICIPFTLDDGILEINFKVLLPWPSQKAEGS